MSRDPINPHHMLGRDVIQLLLALTNQRRRSNGLKRFQCHLTITAYTIIFLRYILRLNFINTGQDSMYLGLEYCCISTQGKAEPSSYRLPKDTSPGPLPCLGPICIPYKPFDLRRSPRAFSPIFPGQPLYLGSRLYVGLIASTPRLKMGSDC